LKKNNISIKKYKNILKIDLNDFLINEYNNNFSFSLKIDTYKRSLLNKLHSYNIETCFIKEFIYSKFNNILKIEIVEYYEDNLNINDKLILLDTIISKFTDKSTIERFIKYMDKSSIELENI
jgi:hypothetical protein